MKKLLCLFIVLCSLNAAIAQDLAPGKWILRVHFGTFRNIGNSMKTIEYNVYYNGDRSKIIYQDRRDVKEGKYISPNLSDVVYEFDSYSQGPFQVNFEAFRKWAGNNKRTTTYLNLNNGECIYDRQMIYYSSENVSIFSTSEGEVSVYSLPKKIELQQTSIPLSGKLFPDQSITINATPGYPECVYNWEYQIEASGWRKFSDHLNVQYGANKSSITFKGSDLNISDADYYQKNFFIRVNTKTDETRSYSPKITTLLTAYPPPTITNITQREQKCSEQNVVLDIELDRSAVSGEKFILQINGFALRPENYSITGNKITLTNLDTGAQNIEIKSTYGGDRKSEKIFTVNPQQKLAINQVSQQNISCNGGNNASITVNASGGNGSYYAVLLKDGVEVQNTTFTNNENAGAYTFSGLVAGNYSIRINNSGCDNYQYSGNITITQPSSIIVSNTIISSPKGHYSTDGVMEVSLSGGSPNAQNGYAVTLDSAGISYSATNIRQEFGSSWIYEFSGLKGGTYSFTAKDNNNCTISANFEITSPPPIVVSVQQKQAISCNGRSDASLYASASGGVGQSADDYNYAWYRVENGVETDINQNVQNAQLLPQGTYIATATDKNGISAKSNIVSVIPPQALAISFVVQDISCEVENSGKITATVSGGKPPYSYAWTKEGETKAEISMLEAGDYLLFVTDKNGCTLQKAASISSPLTLSVDVLKTEPNCVNGGEIELKLSGNKTGSSVRWLDNNSSELKRNNLSAGKYIVELTDQNSCKQNHTINLKEPETFTISLPEDFTMCSGQIRELQVSSERSNLSYRWSLNGEALEDRGSKIVVSEAGLYKVVATDQNACTASDEISVSVSETDVLELIITAPSKVVVDSEIHAVNLSTMPADKIEWILPDKAKIVSQSETDVVFFISEIGSYQIALEGTKGSGKSLATRKIEVLNQGDQSLSKIDKTSIKQFIAAPNPTTGYFKVHIELDSPEDFELLLYSPKGVLMDTKQEKSIQSQFFEYEIHGNSKGVYQLHLITKTEKSLYRITLK